MLKCVCVCQWWTSPEQPNNLAGVFLQLPVLSVVGWRSEFIYNQEAFPVEPKWIMAVVCVLPVDWTRQSEWPFVGTWSFYCSDHLSKAACPHPDPKGDNIRGQCGQKKEEEKMDRRSYHWRQRERERERKPDFFLTVVHSPSSFQVCISHTADIPEKEFVQQKHLFDCNKKASTHVRTHTQATLVFVLLRL